MPSRAESYWRLFGDGDVPAVLGQCPPAPARGPCRTGRGWAGDKQGSGRGTVCRDGLVAGPIDCPQIHSAENWEAPSDESWRRHKQGGRSAGGARIPGEEKTAEGSARGCDEDMISTLMP